MYAIICISSEHVCMYMCTMYVFMYVYSVGYSGLKTYTLCYVCIRYLNLHLL